MAKRKAKDKRFKQKRTALLEQYTACLRLRRLDKGWIIQNIMESPPTIWGPYLNKPEAERDRAAIAEAYVTIKLTEKGKLGSDLV